jgi:hypothetical protein
MLLRFVRFSNRCIAKKRFNLTQGKSVVNSAIRSTQTLPQGLPIASMSHEMSAKNQPMSHFGA